MTFPHPMDDKTGFEATDEDMGLGNQEALAAEQTQRPDTASVELGECDCCLKLRELTQCWVGGLETWACDECRGAA